MSEGSLRAFVAFAREHLEARALELRASTGRGAAKDWPDYQNRVGRAIGVEQAAGELTRLLGRFLNDDDEDDA